jgi:sugar lactone lactonase YvrE
MALGPDGHLYVSSRFDGQVHRLLDDDRLELYATELGAATGLAFGSDGSLYVGDRSGTILRVSPERQVETFATIPASVAAFHLAMGPDDALYVTAPTLATHDAVYRVTRDRLVDVISSGFGRPQGLAFDSSGALYVVDALAGGAGLYRLDPGASRPVPELVLTAPSLVGVAFDPAGGLVLASAETIWRLDCPLKPYRP